MLRGSDLIADLTDYRSPGGSRLSSSSANPPRHGIGPRVPSNRFGRLATTTMGTCLRRSDMDMRRTMRRPISIGRGIRAEGAARSDRHASSRRSAVPAATTFERAAAHRHVRNRRPPKIGSRLFSAPEPRLDGKNRPSVRPVPSATRGHRTQAAALARTSDRSSGSNRWGKRIHDGR